MSLASLPTPPMAVLFQEVESSITVTIVRLLPRQTPASISWIGQKMEMWFRHILPTHLPSLPTETLLPTSLLKTISLLPLPTPSRVESFPAQEVTIMETTALSQLQPIQDTISKDGPRTGHKSPPTPPTPSQSPNRLHLSHILLWEVTP